MSDLKLRPHGEHVKPHYQPAAGQTESTAGASSDAARPAGQASGLVRRFGKDERASDTVTTLNWVKAVYGQAIEYVTIDRNLRGAMLFGGVGTAGIGLFGFWGLIVFSFPGFDDEHWQNWAIYWLMQIPFGLIFLLFGLPEPNSSAPTMSP
jgi:hypothetical protein